MGAEWLSGTKTSATLKSWLPVPRRPSVCHVSTISALSLGIQNMRVTGVPAALRIGLSPSHMMQGHISQRAFMMPLAKSHRPSMR